MMAWFTDAYILGLALSEPMMAWFTDAYMSSRKYECFLMNVWVMMDEWIFVRQACWIHLEMSTPNMEVIYQEWGRLIYVRGFQLISRIQHAILQICVCVRKGYANERICEGWVNLGECVRGVEIRIRYRTDVFYVVDVWLCVLKEYLPGLILDWLINPYEWTLRIVIPKEAHATRLHICVTQSQWVKATMTILYSCRSLFKAHSSTCNNTVAEASITIISW